METNLLYEVNFSNKLICVKALMFGQTSINYFNYSTRPLQPP